MPAAAVRCWKGLLGSTTGAGGHRPSRWLPRAAASLACYGPRSSQCHGVLPSCTQPSARHLPTPALQDSWGAASTRTQPACMRPAKSLPKPCAPTLTNTGIHTQSNARREAHTLSWIGEKQAAVQRRAHGLQRPGLCKRRAGPTITPGRPGSWLHCFTRGSAELGATQRPSPFLARCSSHNALVQQRLRRQGQQRGHST